MVVKEKFNSKCFRCNDAQLLNPSKNIAPEKFNT